jgi:hypothetical protein
MVGDVWLAQNQFLSDYIYRVGMYAAYAAPTLTYNNITGEETLTAGTPSVILGYYVRKDQQWLYDREGNVQGGDAIFMTIADIALVKDGFVYIDGNDFSLTTISGSATTISGTTSTVHGLSVGQSVIISGTTNFDGLYTIATVPSTTTFTITDALHNFPAETSIGRITRNYHIYIIKNIVTRYGQFGNLQQKCYNYCNLFLRGTSD